MDVYHFRSTGLRSRRNIWGLEVPAQVLVDYWADGAALQVDRADPRRSGEGYEGR